LSNNIIANFFNSSDISGYGSNNIIKDNKFKGGEIVLWTHYSGGNNTIANNFFENIYFDLSSDNNEVVSNIFNIDESFHSV